MTKDILRSSIKSKLNQLNNDYKETAAKELFKFITPLINSATRIGIYHAVGSEINLKYIIEYCSNNNKKLYRPLALKTDKYMYFRLCDDNNHKIFTDEADYSLTTNDVKWYNLDLIIIPLLAVDKFGNRLGKGGGYYDYTLQEIKHISNNVILCGVGYSIQMLEATIPKDDWDIKLNYFVSDKKITKF